MGGYIIVLVVPIIIGVLIAAAVIAVTGIRQHRNAVRSVLFDAKRPEGGLPMKSWPVALTIAAFLFGNASLGEAFDADRVFTKGGFVLSVEGGYGEQFDAWNTIITGLDAFNAGVRFGFFPWGITGFGPLKGALEIGVEPFYQRFIDPVDAFFAGLGIVARYHILPFGRFVPYLELSAAPGYTDLRVREQNTDIVFLLFGGIGASYFVTDRTALYAGYRLQHISNANTDSPNRGINSHTGVVGLSILFP